MVISHEAGDEGYEYLGMLEQLAKEENVDMRIVAYRVGEVRQRDSEGRKVYTLWDLYHHADFVTYPSIYEGFGNALLEAIYFRKPVLINRYSIFIRDIEPKGFRLLTMDGFVTPSLARRVKQVLEDQKLRQEIVGPQLRGGSSILLTQWSAVLCVPSFPVLPVTKSKPYRILRRLRIFPVPN